MLVSFRANWSPVLGATFTKLREQSIWTLRAWASVRPTDRLEEATLAAMFERQAPASGVLNPGDELMEYDSGN